MRRYACKDASKCPTAIAAWHVLQNTVYTTPITESIIHHSPALTMVTSTDANATAVAEVFQMFREVGAAALVGCQRG